jgi:hypothetical protein
VDKDISAMAKQSRDLRSWISRVINRKSGKKTDFEKIDALVEGMERALHLELRVLKKFKAEVRRLKIEERAAQRPGRRVKAKV